MKSIGFIMLHFLIFCPSLSHLALCTECITVKAEMVGSNHTRCRFNILKKILSPFLLICLFIFINYFACYLLMARSENNNKNPRHTCIFN